MATGKEFVMSLKKFTFKSEQQMSQVSRALAMRIYSDIIMDTPVDTGRARANWMLSLGQPNKTTTEKTDKTGGSTYSSGMHQLTKFTKGTSIFITNSLPYIERLEYGWSKQAPHGMVRRALARFRRILDVVVTDTKSGKEI